ncbi:ubiquitin-specific protease ubp2 [Yamadazyma tenuis]|uniref:Ubiquitin carboxyl-terminal hydrolase 2 n=1 Tax=Candida tenuis (strain ATCC 10573 / BCRC 21748 / CBS 615 / JCM 9827 / NBRC 10315 / NRRL Y-1498 / VKM Y-70) TaxID=590646 RepID=G3BCJ5_CANTC|nr:cysteine proteinase [Yamadazyma tenuis ATCC 10573]EGV60179.1 cysteine proteinase [Yamadazyma tenuis ATCC 10573]WEJ94583.1 ubiquitin-specific protease ubp2 [Yamadazyma tenuis]
MGDSNNPFINSDYQVNSSHVYTKLAPEQLNPHPYKTLNRLLDDIKWCLPFRLRCATRSILHERPFEYAHELATLVRSTRTAPSVLLLNNELPFFKSREVSQLNDNHENQTLTSIRGLIMIDGKEPNHFRIQVLENKSPFFDSNSSVSKYEYHVIDKSLLSSDDLKQFEASDFPSVSANLVDEVYVSTSNETPNHMLRISIFTSEFPHSAVQSISDSATIKERYLNETKNNPNLNPETIPNGLQCIQKLLNVLKGPLLLDSANEVKTIDLSNTSLASMVDIDLLLSDFGFTKNESILVPPKLSDFPSIRESYLRKVVELICLGKQMNVHPNDFNSNYSFSDSLSLIFSTFNEFDKQLSQTFSMHDKSSENSSWISLSCCSFFQDELIIKCFENTIASDPSNSIFYVDHLHNIIAMRNKGNSKLRSYVNSNARKGRLLGFSDYTRALADIGIVGVDGSPSELLSIDDDYIISVYESSVKQDFRNYSFFNRSLEKIAFVKNSDVLKEFLNDELLPVDLAIPELGIEEITEDDVVITAYEFKSEEISDSGELLTLKKALQSISINRKSFILMNYIESNLPELLGKYGQDFPINEALDIMESTPSTNEFELINKFQAKLMSSDIRVLRRALKSINNYRKSKIIEQFLRTGKLDPSLLPVENWPAGLDNIGNTCYLNSLLQYYFSIKPLRDMVLEFEEHDLNFMEGSERKIGGRKIDVNETKRASQFIYHLQALFHEMINTNKRCVQPSKGLAFLSFLPASQPVNFSSPLKDKNQHLVDGGHETNPILIDSDNDDVDDMVIDATNNSRDKTASLEEIQNPFSSDNDPMTVEDVLDGFSSSSSPATGGDESEVEAKVRILPINTEDLESTIEIGRQQDVTECIENVNFQIETALDPEVIEADGEQYDLIKKLFYGKTKQTITPIDGESKSRTSVERFSSLIINISDHPKNIYDALDNYFNADIVNLEEGLVKKSLTIIKLPDILQFQVQRVLFDRERLMAYKSIEPIPFSEKLYMDRYLETEDKDILDKREEVFQWKSEISQLQNQKHDILHVDETSKMNVIDSLITTKKYLQSIKDTESFGIDTDLIEYIQTQITSLNEKVVAINTSIEQLESNISSQFNDYQQIAYSIFAVFIHRGEASYGHYWIYIKDPHQHNIYRKYNDEIVTEVPESEVFNFIQGNTATPYYIAYVKEGLEHEYVEPLKRVVKC